MHRDPLWDYGDYGDILNMPTGLLQTLQRVGELCYLGKKKELQAVAATVS